MNNLVGISKKVLSFIKYLIITRLIIVISKISINLVKIHYKILIINNKTQ